MRGVLCLTAVFLAGCCVVPFSPSEVPVGAPSEGGGGPRQVTLTILGPEEPVDGVPVMLFWEDPAKPTGTNDTILYVLGLRSAAGKVVGHVPTDVTVWVAAGAEGNWTEEWLPDVATPGTAPVDVTVRVYPRRVTGVVAGTWSPAAASVYSETGSGPVSWQAHDILPGSSPEGREGFAHRLASTRMSVNWTNGLTAQADMALAAYHADGATVRCLYQDAADQLGAQGPQTERFDSAQSDQAFSCDQFTNTPPGDYLLMAGPATGRPGAMPLGLPYELSYDLEFGYPSDIEELCRQLAHRYVVRFLDPQTGEVYREEGRAGAQADPIPAAPVVGVALALLAVAVVVRRRGS